MGVGAQAPTPYSYPLSRVYVSRARDEAVGVSWSRWGNASTKGAVMSITGLSLTLSGTDGNAFAILGSAQRALENAGLKKDYWKAYHKKATSGDYDNLLRVTCKYFDCE